VGHGKEWSNWKTRESKSLAWAKKTKTQEKGAVPAKGGNATIRRGLSIGGVKLVQQRRRAARKGL